MKTEDLNQIIQERDKRSLKQLRDALALKAKSDTKPANKGLQLFLEEFIAEIDGNEIR